MATTHPPSEVTLTAPQSLGLETRSDFRCQAIERLDQLPDGGGQLTVDLSATSHVDSAGLGALMLVQRHAAEHRRRVVLRAPSDELRFLLVLTKLADLFEIEDAAAV